VYTYVVDSMDGDTQRWWPSRKRQLQSDSEPAALVSTVSKLIWKELGEFVHAAPATGPIPPCGTMRAGRPESSGPAVASARSKRVSKERDQGTWEIVLC
jgi:hypothetical protein